MIQRAYNAENLTRGKVWKPRGANGSDDILHIMFDYAFAWGHRPETAGNPCTGVVPSRRLASSRLLGANDLARLGAVLRQLEDEDENPC